LFFQLLNICLRVDLSGQSKGKDYGWKEIIHAEKLSTSKYTQIGQLIPQQNEKRKNLWILPSSIGYRSNIPGYSTLANFEYSFEPDGPSTYTVK